MKVCSLTDSGRVRDHNEDNLIVLKNKYDEYLLAVADGMGGHKAGEVASGIVVDLLKEEFEKIDSFSDKEFTINWIRKTVSDINEKIFKYTYEHTESKGMGTTLVICICSKDYVLFGNIGDSSGFVYKDNKVFKVTKDHTLVNLLIATGELSEEDAKFHPKKNVLMKALGAVNPAEVDIFDVENNIDGVILASDGLTNMLSISQIEGVLKMNISIEEKVKKFITKSNNRGGTDNISVILLDCESGGVK